MLLELYLNYKFRLISHNVFCSCVSLSAWVPGNNNCPAHSGFIVYYCKVIPTWNNVSSDFTQLSHGQVITWSPCHLLCVVRGTLQFSCSSLADGDVKHLEQLTRG
jgi:hypothetical protein